MYFMYFMHSSLLHIMQSFLLTLLFWNLYNIVLSTIKMLLWEYTILTFKAYYI